MANLLKTENYIVAFIDVLGAKQLISQDMDGSLNTIHEAYDKSLELYKELFERRVHFDFTIFSDNIVVARKVNNEKVFTAAFHAVHMMAAIIQGHFLFRNILTRGGIAYGKYFADDTMVWGDALVKAHLLEESIAIYPRVVIDPELVWKLNIFPKGPEKSQYWLKQDQDGILYVDYLKKKFIKNYDFILLQELARYDDRIADAKDDTKVIQKIIWHTNYINCKLTEGDAVDEDETIEH